MTPTLKQYGMFYNETKFQAGSHMDMTYMPAIWNNPENVKDLGMFEYWSQARKAEIPLYSMSQFGGKNVVEHDSPYYKFSVATAIDETVEMVKDITSTDTPGADDLPFEIMVSRPAFGFGDILKPSQYSPYQMVVTQTPMRMVGEAAIYTVKLMSNIGVKFMSKLYLTAGQKVGKFGSLLAPEFGTNYSSWNRKGLGVREYMVYVGNAEVNSSYHITKQVDKNGIHLGNVLDKVMEFYQIEGMQDPTTGNLTKAMAKKGMSTADLASMGKDGKVAASFAFKMDDIALSELSRDYTNSLMWSTGGNVQLDGQEDIVAPTGLWHQLNSGYFYAYNLNEISLKLFKQACYNYFVGKKDFPEAGSEPIIVIETGFAGREIANRIIREEAASTGFLINAHEIGAISGGNMSLGVAYFFSSITLPGIARLDFKYNPAYDNINQQNEIDNPTVNGYRTSSYSFVMYDVDSNSDNIMLLKNSDSKVTMMIENGNAAHPITKLSNNGAVNSFLQTTPGLSGFRAKFSKKMDALLVKDPTRVLKIVLYNRVTNRPFGEIF